MKDRVLVFYAGMLYGDYAKNPPDPFRDLRNLPEGAYIRFPSVHIRYAWYRSDYTPVLEHDVPKELKLLALLLTS